MHGLCMYSNYITFCVIKPESDWSTLHLIDVVLINHQVALADRVYKIRLRDKCLSTSFEPQ